MDKLKGMINTISRQYNGKTYFTGADGEAHPNDDYYHCGECKYFERIGDSFTADCSAKARYKVGINTLSCPKFEEV